MIKDRQSPGVQMVHALNLAMYCYAQDNEGDYPDGKNSLEVCQKLMAGGYIIDPTIFFVPLPGKTKPLPGQILKAENISWDFTGGASVKDSGCLPVVFLTGYRVTYARGSAAFPRAKTVPQTWLSTWWAGLDSRTDLHGIVVGYVDNSVRYMPLKPRVGSAEAVPNFVPADFDAKGKTYRQITPEGVLHF